MVQSCHPLINPSLDPRHTRRVEEEEGAWTSPRNGYTHKAKMHGGKDVSHLEDRWL